MLIEPESAKQYELAQKKDVVVIPPDDDQGGGPHTSSGRVAPVEDRQKPDKANRTHLTNATSFLGIADVPAATAKMRLVQIADEIVSLLASDPNATIRLTVEIAAEFSTGVSDAIKRGVSENATSLGFKTKDWE